MKMAAACKSWYMLCARVPNSSKPLSYIFA